MTRAETGVKHEAGAGDEFAAAYRYWQEIQMHPETYLVESPNHFCAGGGLAAVLGEDNLIWNRIRQAARGTSVEIAGIEFSLSSLKLVGRFYRWLGTVGHCVDERLDEAAQYSGVDVHAECGAAAAVGKVIGLTGGFVESELAGLHGNRSKQPLLKGTEGEHYAVAIYIDLSGKPRMVGPQWRRPMKENHALAFHASLPLDKIEAFIETEELQEKRDGLIESLYRWNVQIPINIIHGSHNAYQKVARKKGMILAVDRRGVSATQALLSSVELQIDKTAQAYLLTRLDIA